MLEESKMDKKSQKPQSRASAIDCKKNNESTYKPWPRNSKKREGSGNAPKNEPYRKNLPSQRGRGQVDRRPRPRGGATGFSVGGTQDTGIEDDDEPEIGSVFVPGSKKQNLNHLLNFMYPARGGQERGPERRGAVPRRPQPHRAFRLDHDLYLRANCQFVVREDGDFKANLFDPDIPLKWEQIEEIVVRSTGKSECPICLGAPACARAGRCGHVYCWPCALHYARAHSAQPPPCPVCAAPLHVADMKPTKMLQWDSPSDEVTMRLVRRLRGDSAVQAAPARGAAAPAAAHARPLADIQQAPYTKFFTATKQQIRDILERERKEIQNQILAEIDTTEIVYMEQVLDMLKAKEEKINAQFEKPVVVEEIDNSPIVYEKQEINEKKVDWFDMTDEGTVPVDKQESNDKKFDRFDKTDEGKVLVDKTPPDIPSVESIEEQIEDLAVGIAESALNPDAPTFVLGDGNDNLTEEFPLIEETPIETDQIAEDTTITDIDKENQAKYFYFYQGEDGQQVFLHSLNVRVLNASWGALAAAPPVVKGRVLHRETLSLGEQTRKHMPYTAHLPLYCSFDIVELDLRPPYVTEEALNSFADELERRARMRARAEREERRRERAYRRQLEGPPKPDLSSAALFPPAPISSPPRYDEVFVPLEDASASTSAASPPAPSGLSFAKMASTSGTWRVRKVAPEPPPPATEDGAGEEGGAPRTLSLSDAIEAALHAAPAPHTKKNKKSKQKVLFATGMQRAA